MQECKSVSFKGQTIFIGMDVHKKSWRVTERHGGHDLKTYNMTPSTEELVKRLHKQYPEAGYRSVYEAGFCGFWIDRELREYGIDNIVVNPADIPTSEKERLLKNDVRDSRKLARELENGSLAPIYIPSLENLRLRDLVRRETQIVNNMTRCKNRIKSYLSLYNLPLPPNWSGAHLQRVQQAAVKGKIVSLCSLITELSWLKQHKVKLMEAEKKFLEHQGLRPLQRHLDSIPGIGFRTTVVLISEIWDMKRFKTDKYLTAYVGLAPRLVGSGEHEQMRGAGKRKHKLLQSLLIESAWRAITKDMDLRAKFGQILIKGNQQKAITVIARKLLMRVRAVWLQDRNYQIKPVSE